MRKVKRKRRRFKPNKDEVLENIFGFLFIGMLLANIFFPIVLLFTHSDMDLVWGNPKPLYFFDIGSSCSNYDANIISTLEHLSKKTGVKFIRLPYPSALVIGGFSYGCRTGSYDHLGESEAGIFGGGYIIIAWNRIKLSNPPDGETILHETLHSMGFGHSQNSGSIMYPYHRGSANIDTELVEFIRKMYVNNPLAYFIIIPLNSLYLIFGLLFSIIPETTRKSTTKRKKSRKFLKR